MLSFDKMNCSCSALSNFNYKKHWLKILLAIITFLVILVVLIVLLTSKTTTAATATTAKKNTNYEKYCNISRENTLCLYGDSIGSECVNAKLPQISKADQKRIVYLHNSYRRKVAKGLERRPYGNGGQPRAANMREMIWDDEIALMAQAHANQCVQGHDHHRNVRRFKVGQNFAYQGSSATYPKIDWGWAMERWYEEVVDVYSLEIIANRGQSPVIGHYTQLVWADTYAIGCGVIQHGPDSRGFYATVYVCNYAPNGNFIGQLIYKKGPPASSCPYGTFPYDYLCRSLEEP